MAVKIEDCERFFSIFTIQQAVAQITITTVAGAASLFFESRHETFFLRSAH